MNDASFFRTPPSPLACAIIAGGRSSRFGSDKALAEWNPGQAVLEAVLEAATSVFSKVIIVGGKDKGYAKFGTEVVEDIIPGFGPLSGIHTALRRAGSEKVMMLACDMPAVSPDFLRYISELKTWAPIVAPESSSGIEPLHAIWHRSLLPIVENSLRKGGTGLRNLLSTLPCRLVSKNEAVLQGFDLRSIESVNTVDALQDLKQAILSHPDLPSSELT